MERVVYGMHSVAELLRNPRTAVSALFVARESGGADDGLAAVYKQAARRGLVPVGRSRGELDRLAGGGVHQGILALCGDYHYADGISALMARAAAQGEAPLLLVLDGVTDPQNLGALVRSAYVLGAHGVVMPKDRAAPVTPAAVKAAAGATELLPIAQVANLARALLELEECEVWRVAAVAPGQGGKPPWAIDLTQPTALCLGGEGRGLRPLSRKSCEIRVEIPMSQGLHGASLNVAAAGAVLLYEALRQRQAARRSEPSLPSKGGAEERPPR